MKNYLKITFGILLALGASRFIPHPPNFTSLIALSFYVPAILGKKYIPMQPGPISQNRFRAEQKSFVFFGEDRTSIKDEDVIWTLSSRSAKQSDIDHAKLIGIKEIKMIDRVTSYLTIYGYSTWDEESLTRIESVKDQSVQTPEDLIMNESLKNDVMATIKKLPDRERLALVLYYFEELTLQEIANVIGVSESRVSQILNKTLMKIRVAVVEE